ncbi:efflux RND transporter permease subunit [Ectobacillus sp. sgz5001026]|uniref:efflux RND transporter permease subunit n=1 Tax=Ectobacillus sp. sgz5001026 TaxID=3242473 RepID=UPI0036D380B8
MNFLTRFSLKNAVAVFIISFLLIVGGLYSFSSLKVDLLPNVEFPQLSVEVVYPGASPADVNEQVTTKLEEKFKGIEGIKKVSSSSFETMGIVNLEFPFNTDMTKVEQQINTLIKDAKLPDTAQTKVNRFSFGTFPIYNISIFGKDHADVQTLLKDEIIPELNKIPGINSVTIGGTKESLVQITVDKEKATQYGLTLSSIKDQINAKYLSFPAGRVNTSDLQVPVRVDEKVDQVKKLEELQLTVGFLGTKTTGGTPTPVAAPILLKDVAKIEAITDQAEKTRYNQKDSISMAITKKQDANTVEVADKVMSTLKKYDDKINYNIGYDSASGIKQSVESLVKEGLLGALFASIAVLLFLRNIRATIIAIISIPLSLLFASIFLSRLNISLNIMTLGGMAVAVGRVVDDSIVVIENIFRRVRKSKDGMSNELVESSTKEILKAITASTITTVVVFLPLGFVGGITGEFFLPFALTVVFSLLASLLVAITVVPILARFAFKQAPKEEKENTLQRAYARAISWSLNHKAIILISSFVLLIGSFTLVSGLGFTFIPNEQQKTLVASIELPASTSVSKTNDISLKMEKMFAEKSEIKEVTTSVGGRNFSTGLKRENQANYFINLKDVTDVQSFIPKLEKDMQTLADEDAKGTKLGVQELSSGGPPSNNNVDIDLYSNNLDSLQEAATKVEDYLKKNDNLKYVTNNFSEKQKQYLIQIKSDKASEYGLSGFQILGTISDQTTPVSVGTLKLDNKDQSVQLSYDKSLTSREDLEKITLFSQRGPISLSDVADVKDADTFTSIQKLDGKVYARVSAQVKGNNTQKVTQTVVSGVKTDLTLPKDVSLTAGGGSDDTVKTFQDLLLAMLVAIGLVYLTMLITFGKARIPFIILSSLIFVPIGAFVFLFLAKEPLSVSVMIGFLMLIGIVTTNAIVLVDRIGQNHNLKGMTIRDSLIEAGKTRLRPILMTAFATITALIPLALTSSSGTLISKGLAITVIGGLTSSTLLTLIIVPIMYELFFRREAKKERKQTSK